ncbi:MAG: methionine adenosyltransferase domain-containing protein [Desulfovibrio sp.]|nr:methionine adenosyltransferase domain-containing protein [Desulfovibrio sp.]
MGSRALPRNAEGACGIGVADPVNVLVSSRGTSDIPDEVLTKAVREVIDLRPYFISKLLDLKRPVYSKTTCYGHFGRELPDFTWKKTEAVTDLRTAPRSPFSVSSTLWRTTSDTWARGCPSSTSMTGTFLFSCSTLFSISQLALQIWWCAKQS